MSTIGGQPTTTQFTGYVPEGGISASESKQLQALFGTLDSLTASSGLDTKNLLNWGGQTRSSSNPALPSPNENNTSSTNLIEDFAQLATMVNVQGTGTKNPSPSDSEKAAAQGFESLLDKQTPPLTADQKSAMLYAAFYPDKSTLPPDMKAKVQTLQEQAGLTGANLSDPYPVNDQLSFQVKQSYDSSLNNCQPPLDDKTKNQASFLFYHPEELSKLSPEDQKKFAKAIEINNELSPKVYSNVEKNCHLPSDWKPDPALLSSTFDAVVLGNTAYDISVAVGQYAAQQSPPLTQAQKSQLIQLVITPNAQNPMNAAAASIRTQVLGEIDNQFSLPSSYTPNLSNINKTFFSSAVGTYLTTLNASQIKDAKTASNTIEKLPPNSQNKTMIAMLQAIVAALSMCKDKLVQMQNDDSAVATKFSNAESEFRQVSAKLNLDVMAKQAQMAAKAAAKAKTMKIVGPVLFAVLLPLIAIATMGTATSACIAIGIAAESVSAVATAVTAVQMAVTIAMQVDSSVNGDKAVLQKDIIAPMQKSMGKAGFLGDILVTLLVSLLASPGTGLNVMATQANPFTDIALAAGAKPKDAAIIGAVLGSIAALAGGYAIAKVGASGVAKLAANVAVTEAEEGAVTAKSAVTAGSTGTAASSTAATATGAISTAAKTSTSLFKQIQGFSDAVMEDMREIAKTDKLLAKAEEALDKARTGNTATGGTNLKDVTVASDNLNAAQKASNAAITKLTKRLETVQNMSSAVHGACQAVVGIANGAFTIKQGRAEKELADMQADLKEMQQTIDLVSKLIDGFFSMLSGESSMMNAAKNIQKLIDGIQDSAQQASQSSSTAVHIAA